MTDIGTYAIKVADLLDIPRSEARKHIAQRTCRQCGARPFWPSKHHMAVVSHRPGCTAVADAKTEGEANDG